MSGSHFSRRDLLRIATLASLSPLACPGQALSASATTPAGSPKKGLGISRKQEKWDDKLAALRCKWFYTWIAEPEKVIPEGIEFIPMVFGRWRIEAPVAKAAAYARRNGVREILGFNVPDREEQANMNVEKALDAWPLLMETGLRLGSPACAHPGKEWMKEFMAGVEERKLRVDFICMHSYGGPDAEGFVKRLESVHAMFGRPIWITEFAVGDWDAKSPEANRHRPSCRSCCRNSTRWTSSSATRGFPPARTTARSEPARCSTTKANSPRSASATATHDPYPAVRRNPLHSRAFVSISG